MSRLAEYTDHIAEISKLHSAISLLSWDQQTHMPPKGAPRRAQVLGKLSKMAFELSVSDQFGEMIEHLGQELSTLSDLEAASVKRAERDYKRHRAIPPSLVEERTVARSEAHGAWVAARRSADFAAFRPHLEKMVGFARRFADLHGYAEHPYDALLEDFEAGMTVAKLRAIVDPLKRELVPFLKRLMDEGTAPDTSALTGSFDVSAQRNLARRVLREIGYDFEAGALDDVAHPFTTTIGPGDVRVTNRYSPNNIMPGLFAALHEGGHALYNQGFAEDLFPLGLARGASNGIHESQSRMIENQVGRSRAYWRHIQPALAEAFPHFATVDAETLYRAVNVVAPSFIRVEADEVTYNLHIMLRFELEVGLLDGSVAVTDLPSLWNEAMQTHLGIVPPDDTRGVLQDVHWSMGLFGYFPSYMLGNLYAAQMLPRLRADLPSLDAQIQSGDFAALLHWLRENVHRLGAIYLPTELIERVTGSALDARHFVRYIHEKYGEIYRVRATSD